MSSKTISWRAAVVGVVTVGVILVALAIAKSPEHQEQAIQRSDAERLFHRAIELAQAGDYVGLCRSISASRVSCEEQLSSTHNSAPGSDRPTIKGATSYRGSDRSVATLVLHVSGIRSDGSVYNSDFAVVHSSQDPTKLVSLTPIFWSGVKFGATERVCDSGSAEACGGAIDTAPTPTRP